MSRIVRLQALVFNESSGKCHKNLTQIPSWHHFSLSGYCDYFTVQICNLIGSAGQVSLLGSCLKLLQQPQTQVFTAAAESAEAAKTGIFLFLLFSGWNMHQYELREEMQTDLFN